MGSCEKKECVVVVVVVVVVYFFGGLCVRYGGSVSKSEKRV